MMLITWKSVKTINGKEQIIQNEAQATRCNAHYNWLYYWSPGDRWMYALDLRVVSDVRIKDVDCDN